MEVVIKQNVQEVALLAAKMVARLVRKNPRAVLGLATGNTPLPMYRELIRMHRQEKLSFKRVTTFNLDEYLGLKPDHPASYHHFMMENFFDHIDIPKSHIHIPQGAASNMPKACEDYEKAIRKAGGIDLQILGIGAVGHIGFNEPSSSFSSRTRIKALTKQTVRDNQKNFPRGESVPNYVITMGLGTIQDARCCVLMACGKNKAKIVASMVEGPITSMVPASILQTHPHATVLVDEAASSRLIQKGYYRFAYENKPEYLRDVD